MRSTIICILVCTVLAGCDDESGKALEWATSQVEKAQEQANQASQERSHVQLLRDTDRMLFDSEMKTATAEVTTWRGLLVGLSIVFALVLIWLAREVRLRRVLSHILLARREQ